MYGNRCKKSNTMAALGALPTRTQYLLAIGLDVDVFSARAQHTRSGHPRHLAACVRWPCDE